MPSPYVTFFCLFLSFQLWGEKISSSAKSYRSGSLLLRLFCHGKWVLTKCFLLFCLYFTQNTKMLFFFFVTRFQVATVRKPDNRFLGSSCLKTWRSIWFMYKISPSLFCAVVVGRFFLLITGLNQRGDLKAPPFSYIYIFLSQSFKEMERKWWISQCLSWNIGAVISFPIFSLWDIIVNLAESFTYRVMFCFPLRETMTADCWVVIQLTASPWWDKEFIFQCLNISTDDLPKLYCRNGWHLKWRCQHLSYFTFFSSLSFSSGIDMKWGAQEFQHPDLILFVLRVFKFIVTNSNNDGDDNENN